MYFYKYDSSDHPSSQVSQQLPQYTCVTGPSKWPRSIFHFSFVMEMKDVVSSDNVLVLFYIPYSKYP